MRYAVLTRGLNYYVKGEEMKQLDRLALTDLSQYEDKDYNVHYQYVDPLISEGGIIESFVYSKNCLLHGLKLTFAFGYFEEKDHVPHR
jgi:hypothetical protein